MSWMCSADCHIVEPADLWTSRVPRSMRDRAPRYEFTKDTIVYWADGRVATKAPRASMALPDGSLPPPDPASRLALLEADGIWAESFLGNLAGLGVLSAIKDAELAIACARVYNDYLAEVFGPHRDRLVGLALIPARDVGLAVREIERAASLGLRGVTLPVIPPEPYFLEPWEPIWAAASAHGLPISFHAHTGMSATLDRIRAAAEMPKVPQVQNGVKTVSALTESNQAFETCAALIGAGVLDRHPGLHVVFVECGAGWLASAMAAMDHVWAPAPGQDRAGDDLVSIDEAGEEVAVSSAQFLGGGWPYDLRPSEYVSRQVHVTFMNEPAAIAFRRFTGIEPLLWGSDFPHPEGTWPHSRRVVDELFAGVEPEARAAMLGGTFAKLYGLAVPAAT